MRDRKGSVAGILIITALFAWTWTGVPAAADSNNVDKAAIGKLESIKENYLAQLRSESIRARLAAPENTKSSGTPREWLTRINAQEVNMVTNRREKTEQSEVVMDGKKYYTSGKAYAMNMSLNPSVRFSKDPLTGKKVDKSEAVIYADASGKAYYFESEDSFKNFTSLASPKTIYGYSEPN